MIRYIIRRLLIIPPALLIIHFLGFAYAHIARPIRAARTPYVRELVDPTPVWEAYIQHIQNIFDGNLGIMPGGESAFWEALARTTVASLGLLVLAMTISILVGLFFGLRAVRTSPLGTARWLTVFTSFGLAIPSFYLGSLFIFATVFYIIWAGPGSEAPFPTKGFGWDKHLVFPVLALALRPTVQIAQVVAELFSGEIGKRYVIAAEFWAHME